MDWVRLDPDRAVTLTGRRAMLSGVRGLGAFGRDPDRALVTLAREMARHGVLTCAEGLWPVAVTGAPPDRGVVLAVLTDRDEMLAAAPRPWWRLLGVDPDWPAQRHDHDALVAAMFSLGVAFEALCALARAPQAGS